jgi:hypothetical protein
MLDLLDFAQIEKNTSPTGGDLNNILCQSHFKGAFNLAYFGGGALGGPLTCIYVVPNTTKSSVCLTLREQELGKSCTFTYYFTAVRIA